jgi:hypothetical protein
MGFRADFAEPWPEVFSDEGEDAVFTPAVGGPIPCKIFIDFDVLLQPMGVESQVYERGTTITALMMADADIGIGAGRVPVRGETFTWNGTIYTVRQVLENDGLTAKAAVT